MHFSECVVDLDHDAIQEALRPKAEEETHRVENIVHHPCRGHQIDASYLFVVARPGQERNKLMPYRVAIRSEIVAVIKSHRTEAVVAEAKDLFVQPVELI